MITNESYWRNLIIDFLAEDITPADELRLRDWLNLALANELYFQELERLWLVGQLEKRNRDFDAELAWVHFSKEINKETDRHKFKSLWFPFYRVSRYAAVFVIAFFLTYIGLRFGQKPLANNTPLLVTTPKGATTQVVLQDGTKVYLNADSKIELAKDFGLNERRVQLRGEAYFEVAKDKNKLFIVESDDVNVKVLGTKFNIQNYATGNRLTLNLLEGSVVMGGKGVQEVIVKPNEQATLIKGEAAIKLQKKDAEETINWTRGRLIFHALPFKEIVYILERHFNIEITVEDPKLENRVFFGEFVNGETIEQILRVMTADKTYGYTIKGNKVTIYRL